MPFDDQSELFYWVDENDEVLGSVKRGEAHKNRKIIHRSIFVVVVSSENKVLLQRRSKNKDTFPNYWTVSVSGHVTYGESYNQAAKKETREELGIDLDMKLIGKKLIDTEIEQEYSAIYQAKFKAKKIKFDKTEIVAIRWVKIRDIPRFVKEKKVTPAGIKVFAFMGWLDSLGGKKI